MRPRLRARWLALVVAVAAAVAGCVDDPGAPEHFNPLDPDVPGAVVPGRPRNLSAEAGDRQVTLNWEAPIEGEAVRYRVYRAERAVVGQGELSAFGLLDSADSLGFVDHEVTNNSEYHYRVAAVAADSLEGEPSAEVSAVPAVYAVTIEGGQLYTSDPAVVIHLTAPQGTQLVRVSNDSTMADASFMDFTSYLTWYLSPGDGPKSIYVEFRGPRGESSGRHRVTIELDTVAAIRAVTEGSGGARLAPGDTLHLAVDAGEPGGTATADISGRTFGIRLFDDGTRGDAAAADGIYEVDYAVEGGDDVLDALVTAHFTDRAGNQASPMSATARVTIAVPPAPVLLQAPADSTAASLRLEWRPSEETDFAFYRLYRAHTAGVDTASSRVLVAQIAEAATSSYRDENLEEDVEYHYLLYVFDRVGLSAPSNEVSGRTANGVPPSVTLAAPTAVSPSGLTLSWSESAAPDFSAYLAYRSDEPGADTSATLLATLSRRDERQLAVTGLTENTPYYFRVYVRDRSGFLSASNEIEARTANLPPTAAVLDTPTVFTDTEVELHWSPSADHDFREYRVYRDTTAAVTEDSRRIRTVNDRAIVTHTDGGLRENTRYYYRVYVADTGDSVAASQIVSATTVNVAPSPVTLATPDSAEITPETVHLSWSASSAHDFARYRLFRDSVPGVSTSSDSVFCTDLRDLDFCDDVGLSDSTAYYYRVFVEDRGGLLTGSNEVRVLTPPAGP